MEKRTKQKRNLNTFLIFSLFFLTACIAIQNLPTPVVSTIPSSNQSSTMASLAPQGIPSYISQPQSSAHPWQTDGQVLVLLEISPENNPQIWHDIPRTTTGLVDTNNLSFRVLSESKKILQTGRVTNNQFLLDAQKFEESQPPYTLELQLPQQQLVSTLIKKAIRAGETIKINFEVANTQTCNGDACINIIGNVENKASGGSNNQNTCAALVCNINSSANPPQFKP